MIATSGINSSQFNKKNRGEFFSGYVIISLGSNDSARISTLDELISLRKRIFARKRVVWILPAGTAAKSGIKIQSIQEIVNRVAKENGDVVIPISSVSADKIHPSSKGYRDLASSFPR